MAQRNSPSRRFPGEPLVGVLRNMAYQARYSNRRRADVATVTNRAATAVSAEAAAAASEVAALAAPAMAATLSATADEPVTSAATLVATADAPKPGTATLLRTDENGRATLEYEDRGSTPVITATVIGDRPAVATVIPWGESAATVYAWTLPDLLPAVNVPVGVHVFWP